MFLYVFIIDLGQAFALRDISEKEKVSRNILITLQTNTQGIDVWTIFPVH